MPLFELSKAYKPFQYPWAYEFFVQSEQMHWLAREVPLNEDVVDWKKNLTDDERTLLTQIFRFFTNADIDVSQGYIEKYMPRIKPTELRMMMSSFAGREAVHIQAYSTLIDEIGMPETMYSAFREFEEMQDKHDFMFAERTGLEGFAEDIAVFSAFGEGLQLFSSFVILLNFTRFGKMKGMGQIVSWSIRDESLHVEGMIKVFDTLIQEHPELWTADFKARLVEICDSMVTLEDRFIDLAFGESQIEGLTADEVKQYIRHIADRRLIQLGIAPHFGVKDNPLPWVDVIVNGKEHTNFFENRPTDYAKASLSGNFDDDAFDGM